MRVALAAALILIAGCREPIVRAPSLLLITTDSLRADALSCYGGPASAGTAICSLAERGALFVWAFSTEPELAPAAATLLTSLPAAEHGVTPSAASFLRSNLQPLAAQLSAAGLATAAFVSAPELNRSRNLQLGFGHYEVAPVAPPGAAAAAVTGAFQAWLQARRPAEQAWFVWLHYPAARGPAGPGPTLSLAELDGHVETSLAAARAATQPHELGIGFTALLGEAPASAPALALERVRIPMLWTPPGGVEPQQPRAPVALLDLAPTYLRQAGVLVPARLAGEALRVGPLPPAQASPARPLRFSAGNEVGVVISRRYYARPRGAELARTALLPDDGGRPRVSRVAIDSEAAQLYEAELDPTEEDLFRDSGREIPPGDGPGADPPGSPGGGLSGGSTGNEFSHNVDATGAPVASLSLMNMGSDFSFAELAGLEGNLLPPSARPTSPTCATCSGSMPA